MPPALTALKHWHCRIMTVQSQIQFNAISREATEALGRSDLQAVVALIQSVQSAQTPSSFFKEVHSGLLKLIPADALSLSVTRFRAGMEAVTVESHGQPDFSEEHYAYYSAHALEHPISRHFVETGECRAIRVSDLMPTEEWIQTPFWQFCLKWLDYRYSMIVVWPIGRQSIFNFDFDRIREDFTEREKHLLDAVFPFIGRHYQTVVRMNRLRESLRDRKRASARAKRGKKSEALRLQGLTPREEEVFRWLGEGKDNQEIGVILGISPRTAQKHTENILRKLQLENRYAAAAHAALMGE